MNDMEVTPALQAELKDLDRSVKTHIDHFKNRIVTGEGCPAIATGFPLLDCIFDGGLHEGLYIMGALSSMGKTSLMLQMADQMAARGKDVIIYSLEMARYELMAKSVSRLTYIKDKRTKTNAKTARDLLSRHDVYSFQAAEHLDDCIEIYREYAEHLYITEGLGEVGAETIGEDIAEFIKKYLRQPPVVIVDYLQILRPSNPRASDKQNMDTAIFKLKRISREHGIPIIGISSFNRSSYTKRAAMEAFKESGAIEYSSDVLMTMQFKNISDTTKEDDMGQRIKEEKRRDVREVELEILKNRNGKTGDRIYYEYRPRYNLFTEKGKAQDE